MAGLMLAILLGALEQNIVGIALPSIALQLHGFEWMAWVVSAYLVASTVATPIYGRLGDLIGRRRVLAGAIVLFVIASAACAAARSMPELVLARVLQGLGGGGLITTAQAVIADLVPLRERGRYQGYISSVWAFAGAVGPIAGGFISHWLSWRWIFWLNLPLGLLTLAVIWRALAMLPRSDRRPKLDLIGAALLAAGTSALLIAVTRTGQGVALLGAESLALLIGGAVLIAVFLWHERRTEQPLLPLGLLRDPTIARCNLALFLAFAALMSVGVLLPLRLQMVAGLGANTAALWMLAFSLGVPGGAFTAGRRMLHSGHYRPALLLGAALVPTGLIALAFAPGAEPQWSSAAVLVVGIGLGMQLPTSLVAVQNAAPRTEIGIATALTVFTRLLGGAIGVACLGAIFLAVMNAAIGASGASVAGMNASDLLHGALDAASGPAGDALRAAADHALRWSFIAAALPGLLAIAVVMGLEDRELHRQAPR